MYEHECLDCGRKWYDYQFISQCPLCYSDYTIAEYID